MTEVTDDLHCSCLRATHQTSRLRPGAKQTQAGSTFCPQDELDKSQQAVTTSLESLPPVNCQNTMCSCCLLRCQRTLNSVSTCPSRSSLRMRSSSRTTSVIAPSVLLHQLRLLSLLIFLSVTLFHQVDLATARAMGQPQQQEDDDATLPVRCTLPFSNYDCGSIATVRYTFRNGSCLRTLEWIGGSDCEYDGTENSFTSEQECVDVCIPAATPITTAGECACMGNSKLM